ncbi:ring finger and CHY zinc finger domain containing 1 isoform 2-T6 [Cochliomyia hominivorax]
MIVEKKSMQATLAEDFNQINLNNINLNITTTNTEQIENSINTTIVQHTQQQQQTKSMAQSPLNIRRHTALPHSLIVNQKHLLHTQQQQQQQQNPQKQQVRQQQSPPHKPSQTHLILEELIDFELTEYKPILRKSLSTPAFKVLEPQHPLKNDVTIITNHNQQKQHHHNNQHHHHNNHLYTQQQQSQQQQQQKQPQQHHQHCQVHKNNLSSNSCNNKSTILKNNNSKNNDTLTTTTTITQISNTNLTTSSDITTTTTATTESLNQRLGCAHYKRRAMFVTPCCNKFYKCRFCHDENESHHFDRKTLTELICSECNTRQKVQERCQNCGIRFGKYTCLICNLFDDSDKRQYHCEQCGICRIGGKENFFHCKVCNMCLPIQLKIDGHRCVENISRSHCPVCLGDIHTSRIPCHIPDCGHLLHKMCFDQLLTSGHYACPTCQTSLIDMTALWEYLDAQAELIPIPKKYENEKIHIFCNDCHKTSKTKFHFIGLKCSYCGAYNTTQDVKRRMSLVTDEPTSA